MALITVITMQHVRILLDRLIVLVTLDMMGMVLSVLVWHLLNFMYTILYAYTNMAKGNSFYLNSL